MALKCPCSWSCQSQSFSTYWATESSREPDWGLRQTCQEEASVLRLLCSLGLRAAEPREVVETGSPFLLPRSLRETRKESWGRVEKWGCLQNTLEAHTTPELQLPSQFPQTVQSPCSACFLCPGEWDLRKKTVSNSSTPVEVWASMPPAEGHQLSRTPAHTGQCQSSECSQICSILLLQQSEQRDSAFREEIILSWAFSNCN